MTDTDDLIKRGYDLCMTKGSQEISQGRQMLDDAASLGRVDALLYLGKSYEREEDYSAAERVYSRGFDKKYRAAIFRLALLHGKRLLKNSDREFYLRTIEALSKDGHFPSIALYTNERLRGSYGFAKRVVGLISFVPNVVRYMWIYARDPKSYRFEQ